MRRRLVAAGIGAAVLGARTWPAQAQPARWPTRPVRVIVPYPAGGGVDVLARALARRLQERWAQPVTVDNRPGANTLIGTELAAHATDGHTLLLTTDATFTINPLLYSKLPYQFERDFLPISRMVSFSQLFVAHPSLPANTLPELVALARSKPGQLSYASYGPGSQPQLATEILKQKAGIFIVHVPYRGIPQALAAVVSGEVPLTWAGIPSSTPYLRAGRIKALAYGGKKRIPAFPKVPTVAEAGYPDIDANVWVGLFAPRSMGPELAERVREEVVGVLQEPAFRAEEIEAKDYDLVAGTPQELRSHIAAELKTREAPIRYSKTKVD
jgi:tripartite-type tricarboxylate transporter receptor subunit TctC